jgi:hypothetical protein
MKKDIRPLYEAHGAEGYYQAHADSYENPHFPQVEALLRRNAPRLDCSALLDLSAGGGEASQIFLALGLRGITGCDPYTYALFEKNTGLPCLRLSFKDIVREGLPGQYSAIVCSFALHLCPEKDLFPLCWQLFQAAPLLLVITPHKRPELERLPGIRLAWEDAELTERGKKVRLKAYEM